jgi:F0F1-type ATP synthase assembly protein I
LSDRKTGAEGDDRNPDMRGIIRPLALASQLGVTMGLLTVATVLASLVLGSWVDRQLGTRPLVTLVFVLIGVLVGMLGTINLAQSTLRELNAAANRQEAPRVAFSARDLGRALLLVAQLALVTLVPIGLGLAVGMALDRAMGTRPAFTIALALLGATIALVAVFFVTGRASRRAGPTS